MYTVDNVVSRGFGRIAHEGSDRSVQGNGSGTWFLASRPCPGPLANCSLEAYIETDREAAIGIYTGLFGQSPNEDSSIEICSDMFGAFTRHRPGSLVIDEGCISRYINFLKTTIT